MNLLSSVGVQKLKGAGKSSNEFRMVSASGFALGQATD